MRTRPSEAGADPLTACSEKPLRTFACFSEPTSRPLQDRLGTTRLRQQGRSDGDSSACKRRAGGHAHRGLRMLANDADARRCSCAGHALYRQVGGDVLQGCFCQEVTGPNSNRLADLNRIEWHAKAAARACRSQGRRRTVRMRRISAASASSLAPSWSPDTAAGITSSSKSAS